MAMNNIKEIIGIISVILTFIGYFPYIRDILKNKNTPHIFSWFIWSINTGIIYALQASSGAGPGSWVTLVLAFIVFFIFLLSFKNGSKNIKMIDVVFLALALASIPIWLVAKQPIVSIVMLVAIDMFGFIPTIRKSWNNPYSETLSLYTITTFRHGLSIFALTQYSIITWLFPVSWVLATGLFSIMLMIRRSMISRIKEESY